MIIPDVHNRTEIVDKILNTVPHNRRVFLGDFFDSWGDSPFDARRTALWLKPILSRPDTHVIFGNHDLAYAFPGWGYTWCPGFKHEKCRLINEVISRDLWEKFNFVWFEQGWVLSHAGFHKEALPCYPDLEIVDQHYLARAADEAFDNMLRFRRHPILEQGESMGQAPDRSGCLWLRWDEFEPISGINQIVGHTLSGETDGEGRYINKVRERHLSDDGGVYNDTHPDVNKITPISSNFCLDTRSVWYGIIENGIFSYHNIDTGEKIIPNQTK